VTPEGRVKKQVKALLSTYKDLYQEWPVPSGYGKSGLDAHCCYRGRYFAIETKAPGKKLTQRQALTAADIAQAGGIVFVVDGSPDGLAELKMWLDTCEHFLV
jgi:hypothetical protein